MRLIEADKVKQVMKDYWKAQVDKALTLTFIDGNEADKRINSYIEHNHELLKAIDELPPAEPDTTTHDSNVVKKGGNDEDRTGGDCIGRQAAIRAVCERECTEIEPCKGGCEAIWAIQDMPSAQPEPETISKWKKEFREYVDSLNIARDDWKGIIEYIDELPPAQPERKTGHWIKDRSGAYCCSKCMEPCASYVMGKPRDKFCKMCGNRNEVME